MLKLFMIGIKIKKIKIAVGRCLVLSINLIHCGNEFRNSVPGRSLSVEGN